MRTNQIDLRQILFVVLLIFQANCQNTSGRIFGIGIGTFIIIIAIVFSVIWCLACISSSNPQVYSTIGVIIPLILILIFIFMPKEVDRPATTSITDSNFIPHVIFLVISIVGLIVAIVFLLLNEVFVFRKAKNIARSAFIMKQQEEQKLNSHQNVGEGNLREAEQIKSKSEQSLGGSRNKIAEQSMPLRK